MANKFAAVRRFTDTLNHFLIVLEEGQGGRASFVMGYLLEIDLIPCSCAAYL